ncbi:sigma-70 family RNA polymerase sigma factor [Ideonella sp. DXS29W]|uniref:Sigma-70 family RNA polymerase sigma factor n=1 Tax=Ideonella lacteola TaxID=2984193 RepID=A0ABU9BKE4_9BURK
MKQAAARIDRFTDASDDALVRAFAGGEALAFDELYARHEQALYRFVRRLLGRDLASQADEVFQDTWLRMIQAAPRWAPQGARFRTWLFTMAHHRAIDMLRRSGREVSGSQDETDGEPFAPPGEPWLDWPAPSAAAPDELAFWQRAGQRLLGCLEELPLPQKAAFLLHHEDELSVAELAAALGIGFETAKSRLRYGLAKLRTCMGAYLPAAEMKGGGHERATA